ncbi:DUF975 family protein [Clostridium botulinum]|nr:DUF975 family protein [Clostridium botulinum]
MEDNTVLSNSQIKSKAKKALKGNWGTAIITFIIFNIIISAFSFVYNMNKLVDRINNPYYVGHDSSFLALGIILLINLILAGPMAFGITKFCMNLVKDGSHKIENMFEGFKHFGGTFIINLVLGIFKFLWTILFLIPYIIIVFIMIASIFSKASMSFYTNNYEPSGYLIAILMLLLIILMVGLSMVLFRYYMTYYIYIDNPDMGAMEAIKESVSMMKGNKTKLLLLYLSFILWYLLGIITIGIAFLWITPYVKSAEAVFYYELKKNKESNCNEEINTLY